ncbi:MAG: hypothetical protein EB127_22905 [Alphaproteobacteria bacterium]|nr:hypothetical protein [Alphaproteobacteria bacterium]
MERDCMLSHGTALFQKERYMECSDSYICYACDLCGLIAVGNPDQNMFKCRSCKNTTEISEIEIPFANKLFLYECMTMGIAPRMIVEKYKL